MKEQYLSVLSGFGDMSPQAWIASGVCLAATVAAPFGLAYVGLRRTRRQMSMKEEAKRRNNPSKT
jgi:hypothetical protein